MLRWWAALPFFTLTLMMRNKLSVACQRCVLQSNTWNEMHTFGCLRWKCSGSIVHTVAPPFRHRFWGSLLRQAGEGDVLKVLCFSLNLANWRRGSHLKKTNTLTWKFNVTLSQDHYIKYRIDFTSSCRHNI